MGKQEIRMLGVTLGLAVLLYAAFVGVGSLRADPPPPAPTGQAGGDADAGEFEEYLVLQVAADGADGWVVRVAGREFREPEALREWIAAEEKGSAGILVGPQSLGGGRIAPIVQACLAGGLTKVEMRLDGENGE